MEKYGYFNLKTGKFIFVKKFVRVANTTTFVVTQIEQNLVMEEKKKKKGGKRKWLNYQTRSRKSTF